MKKGVSSFIVSGRRTYIDVLTRPVVEQTSAAGSGYYFYDLNAKYNHRFSDKDEVFISGISGETCSAFRVRMQGLRRPSPGATVVHALEPRGHRQDVPQCQCVLTNYDFAFTSGQDDFEFGFNSGVVDWTQRPIELVPQPSTRSPNGPRACVPRICADVVLFQAGRQRIRLWGSHRLVQSRERGLLGRHRGCDGCVPAPPRAAGATSAMGPFTRITPGENVLAPDDSTTYGKGGW